MEVQIERVSFLDEYIIRLELSNNQKIYFDLKPQLKTARFRRITSQEYFETGKLIDHCYICWDDITEIQDYEMLGESFIKQNL